eukprot:gnl/MRDRNA2_/MRDRNA2_145124_c0_seq1.p1 gnl/MRDRNA2_/MRDRNA2_145124_c0~~gnl/MRDRNA2_/MRDRNA2_145124_c0_seq1.p1  ORF type:complete len:239 (+),score=61.03 gnl/MRDRNA2_/MRDRNA2_145124_c0_seq1:118-834(+)
MPVDVGCTAGVTALTSAIGFCRVGASFNASAAGSVSASVVGRSVALWTPSVTAIGRGVSVALGGLAGYVTMEEASRKGSKNFCSADPNMQEEDPICEEMQEMRQNLIRNGQKILALAKANRQIQELVEFQKTLLDAKDYEIQTLTDEAARQRETQLALASASPLCTDQVQSDKKTEDLSKKNQKLQEFVEFQTALLDEKDSEIQRLMEEVESLRAKGKQTESECASLELRHADKLLGA